MSFSIEPKEDDFDPYPDFRNWRWSGGDEEGGVRAMETIEESVFSFDIGEGTGKEDSVYVAVGLSEPSMDAVRWTLKNLVNGESTMVHLIHVYPEVHLIPFPMGMFPKNQVNPELVRRYMAEDKGKRRRNLQKFVNVCSASKIKVDTVLVESNMVAKAISDLIPILNVRKLVLGISKSTLRRAKGKKRSGIGEIMENAPEFCDIKIICEGQDVNDQINAPLSFPSSSSSSLSTVSAASFLTDSGNVSNGTKSLELSTDDIYDSAPCMCFRSPRIM